MRKHDVIHKTGSTYHIALSSEDKATATVNRTENFVNFGHVVFLFETCERTGRDADRQTHRQT